MFGSTIGYPLVATRYWTQRKRVQYEYEGRHNLTSTSLLLASSGITISAIQFLHFFRRCSLLLALRALRGRIGRSRSISKRGRQGSRSRFSHHICFFAAARQANESTNETRFNTGRDICDYASSFGFRKRWFGGSVPPMRWFGETVQQVYCTRSYCCCKPKKLFAVIRYVPFIFLIRL